MMRATETISMALFFPGRPLWPNILKGLFTSKTNKTLSSCAFMKLLIAITIFLSILASCKVNEKMIPGRYRVKGSQDVEFVFNENKTFDLGITTAATHYSFPSPQVTGIWKLENNRLKLIQPKTPVIDDSITRFTNISCFNFWDNNGDPVSIRYILVPPERLKPHFGNSLYFFSQDFKPTDTLTFYFDGFPPFKFPGSVPSTIGNNMHKITMLEPNRHQLPQFEFIVRKKRLLLLPKKIQYTKKQ